MVFAQEGEVMSYHTILVLVRLLIVALGAIIVHLALRSHRQHRSNAMLLVSIGFTLITVGAVIEGVLFEFLGFDIFAAHTVESTLVALGFTVIIYSTYGTRT